jgi:hypothetical protein
VRIRSIGGVTALVLGLSLSLPGLALAQDPGDRPAAADAPAAPATLAPQVQAAGMTWRPVVFGGVALSGGRFGFSGSGFAVGGGVTAVNFLDREEFGLQIDGLYANYGEFGCAGCGFNASTFSVSGAFIYNFDQMDNGWQLYAGGGPVITRFNWGFTSAPLAGTYAGIQGQAGIRKNLSGNRTFGAELRAQSVVGGAVIALATLRF